MRISTKYDIGQTVYLITDKDQLGRLVISVTINPGNVVYSLSSGTTVSNHYDFEISETKDVLMATTD